MAARSPLIYGRPRHGFVGHNRIYIYTRIEQNHIARHNGIAPTNTNFTSFSCACHKPLRNQPPTSFWASRVRSYTVEYFSSDLQTGWVVAAHRVPGQTITVIKDQTMHIHTFHPTTPLAHVSSTLIYTRKTFIIHTHTQSRGRRPEIYMLMLREIAVYAFLHHDSAPIMHTQYIRHPPPTIHPSATTHNPPFFVNTHTHTASHTHPTILNTPDAKRVTFTSSSSSQNRNISIAYFLFSASSRAF